MALLLVVLLLLTFLVFYNYLSTTIEEGSHVDIIYTDFKKAFDSVNHDILLDKLSALGIHGSLLEWLSSFLRNRSQVVKFKNSLSKNFKVLSGVPQGSHLGPLLFNLFINDISRCFRYCKFLLCADDLKIFRRIDSQECAASLQRDLSSFENWCTLNSLDLNLSKCHILRFLQKK